MNFGAVELRISGDAAGVWNFLVAYCGRLHGMEFFLARTAVLLRDGRSSRIAAELRRI